jgi:hypothetical protein
LNGEGTKLAKSNRGEITFGGRTWRPAAHDDREQVFRETLLYRASPEERAVLARVGRMVYEFVDVQEAGHSGGRPIDLYAALRAASQELGSLHDFLFASAMVYESNEETAGRGIELSTLAKCYAHELGRVTRWFNWLLGISASR